MSTERQFPRFAIDAQIVIRAVDGGVIARGRATNLSRGGLCAEVGAALERGVRIDVSIALVFEADKLSEPLALPARVVWSTSLGDVHQAGLAFLPLGKDRTHYLDMFIRFLEGDRDEDGDLTPTPKAPDLDFDH